jgi:hypothetical protein
MRLIYKFGYFTLGVLAYESLSQGMNELSEEIKCVARVREYVR